MKQVDTGLRPGDPIVSNEELEALPVGSRVWASRRFTKQENGLWDSDYGPQRLNGDWSGQVQLLSFPEGYDFPRETLDQHRWRIYDGGLEAARRYSVNGVPQAMAQLGITKDMFPYGVGQKVTYSAHLHELPNESIISLGSENLDNYTLFIKSGNVWHGIMGPMRNNGVPMLGKIERVGDDETHQDWLDAQPTETDERRIKSFRGMVWKVGNSYRQQYGWCETFLTVMNAMNISTESERDIDPEDTAATGEMVAPAAAAVMPMGSLFEYITTEGWRYWYVRREPRAGRDANRAGTRRFAAWDQRGVPLGHPEGHYPGGNYSMRVIGRPGEEIPLSPDRNVDLRRMWQGLPEGTVFRFITAHNGGRTYVKNGDNTFVDERGRAQREDAFEWNRVYVVVPNR